MTLAKLRYFSLLFAIACGYHDTAVATYHEPIPEMPTGGAPDMSAAGAAGALVTPVLPACAATYPTTVPGLTSFYRQGLTGQNWVAAEQDCESDGGHLVVVDDDLENDWLKSIAESTSTSSASTNQLLWLGLDDQELEGDFRWVTGEPLSASYWAATEPNSLNGYEDCVEIRGSGEWNDDRCNATPSYVCECDGTLSAGAWCDTDAPETCGDCSTACAAGQACKEQLCQ